MKKNIIIVGDIVDKEQYATYCEISSNTTVFGSFNYFNNLISAATDDCVYVLSCPYFGSKQEIKKTAAKITDTANYFYYNNLGNKYSRLLSLKKKLFKIFETKIASAINTKFPTYIFVTQPNYFYIKTALKIEKKIKNSKTYVFIPDLTIYTSLANKNFVYRTLKKIESNLVDKTFNKIDGLFVFSRQIKELYNKYKCCVVPAIIPDTSFLPLNNRHKIIAYTGTLNEKYGIYDFASCFAENYKGEEKLYIAGSGECADKLKQLQTKTEKIVYVGSLNQEETYELQRKAILTVNPRPSNGEYTKYSFPSKIGEYLSNNGNVACFGLPGFPSDILSSVATPEKNDYFSLMELCEKLCNLSEKEFGEQLQKSSAVCEKYSKNKVFEQIVEFIERN